MSTTFVTPHQSANGSPAGEFALEITANPQQGNSLQWDFANHSTAVMRAGTIAVVAVRKTNTSHEEILKFPFPPMPYDWTMRNPSGDQLTPRRDDSRHCWIIGGGLGFLKGSKDMFLQPGESMVDVNRLMGAGHPISGVKDSCRSGFDMSQPGPYTVQVAQHISSDPNSPEIQSNLITITVLPAEKAEP
jgi:hypothetical protein